MTNIPNHRRNAVSAMKHAKSQTDERQEIKDLIDCLSDRRLEPAEWFVDFIIAERGGSAMETDGNVPPIKRNANERGETE